jgi:hypothetical protein
MAAVSITTRTTKAGERRFAVRYRLGGRAYLIQHGGTFRTLKEARARRDLIAGELATGRNPAIILIAHAQAPTKTIVITVNEWAERFLASRIDIDENTKKNYRSALKRSGRRSAIVTRRRSPRPRSRSGSRRSRRRGSPER